MVKGNVLILYYSQTGNTEKLARAIASGVQSVPNVQCTLKTPATVTRQDFLSHQAIIAGSPVYFGSMAGELKKVFDDFVDLRNHMGDKIGAAFATSGAHSGGKETTILSILQAFLIYGMIVVGDPLDATGHYGIACVGEPDQDTIQQAKKLGARVVNLVLKLNK